MASVQRVDPRRYWTFLYFLLGCWSRTVHGANILMSSYYGMGSHFLAGAKVGESLLKRGHDVTFLVSEAYAHRTEDPAYGNFSFHVFNHSAPKEEILDLFLDFGRNGFDRSEVQFMKSVNKVIGHNINDCLGVLRDEATMRKFEEMDAMVVDPAWNCGFFIRDLLESRSNHTRRVPLVILNPMPNHFGFVYESFGSPFNRAYRPEHSTGYGNRMTFLQRTSNVFSDLFIRILLKSFVNQWHCVLREQTGKSCRGYDLMDSYYGDLMLINTHFAFDFPHALTPNIVPIGGLTCRPASPLTQELEDFMQSSGDHGVVIFTLGTYMASITTIRPDVTAMFAEALRRIPQKVIWQLKELPEWELPPNVKTMPWIPQNDLLGHPKTRVLMYQGGNNGLQEACYHGVPIVVLPFMGDQPDNGARIEARGMGRRLDKHTLSADIIYEALTDVINDKRYHDVAKEVSAIYHDRDRGVSAPDRAAFWIEHVIKFGGKYMKSHAEEELNFIQYHLLDVYAFLTAIFVAIVAIILWVCRFCMSRFIGLLWSTSKSKTE